MGKVADVRAALDFLASRPDVDAERLAVLGSARAPRRCCASRSTTPGSVRSPPSAVHDRDNDNDNDIDLAGGEALAAGQVERAEVIDRLAARRARGETALDRYRKSWEVEYGVIVDPVRTDVASPWRMIWDWNHGWADRGLWENRYALMSDRAVLRLRIAHRSRTAHGAAADGAR